MKILSIAVLSSSLLAACASDPNPRPQADIPAWLKQAVRTVDNGYIIYVGVGEDGVSERARFKAESAAWQDLANECSFAPKGARIEDRYDEAIERGGYRAYAKVGVSFADCESAQAAVTPEEVRKLANVTISEQLQRYRATMDMAPAEVASTESVQTSEEWVSARQGVALVKERVILAPATLYPIGAAQSLRPIPSLPARLAAIRRFERAHPELVGPRTLPYSVFRRHSSGDRTGSRFRERPHRSERGVRSERADSERRTGRGRVRHSRSHR